MNEVFGATLFIGSALLILWLMARFFFFALGGLVKVDRKRKATATAATENVTTMSTLSSDYGPVLANGVNKTQGWLAPHFSFQGTATKQQFILTQVITGIVLGLLLAVGGEMYASESGFIHLLGIVLIVAAICAACWVVWAVSAKRVRDTGVTVWWVLTLLVPPLNLATFVFLLLVPSNEFQGRGL